MIRGEIVGVSLPGVAPAAIKGPHRVGVGACHEDSLRSLKGKDTTLILKQNLRLESGGVRLLGETLAAEVLILVIP